MLGNPEGVGGGKQKGGYGHSLLYTYIKFSKNKFKMFLFYNHCD